jgi:hypothetical protein
MTEETTSMEPIKAESYEVTRFNALRHGVLSHYTVLKSASTITLLALIFSATRKIRHGEKITAASPMANR